jgi:hypothetical protein
MHRHPIGNRSFQRHGQHQRGACGHAADLVVRPYREFWRLHHLLRRDRAVPAIIPSGASSPPRIAPRATVKAAPTIAAAALALAAAALAPAVTTGRPS